MESLLSVEYPGPMGHVSRGRLWTKGGSFALAVCGMLPVAVIANAREVSPATVAIARFVDGAEKQPATATLGGDTRYVLRGYVTGSVLKAAVEIPQSRRLSFETGVAADVPGDAPVVLVVTVVNGTSVRELPGVLVRKAGVSGPGLEFDVDVPPDVAIGGKVVGAMAIRDPVIGRREIRTKSVKIPPHGLLEFAAGLLDASPRSTAVSFEVDVCSSGTCEAAFSQVLDPNTAVGWQVHQLDLSKHEGRSAHFRFRNQATAAAEEGGWSLPVWGNPTLFGAGDKPVNDLNIILLSIDTLRADHLRSYGYEHETAPFIDRLAREGSLFENVVASSTTTGPAHMTIFTSLQPSTHGLIQMLNPERFADVETVAQSMRKAGFETGAITEGGPMREKMGFQRGFNTFQVIEDPGKTVPVGNIEKNLSNARDWLRRHAGRRRFLFLHTYQTHFPLSPPERYHQLFVDSGTKKKQNPAVANRVAAYDQSIRYVDDQLRSFVGEMKRDGLLERTVLVITSDHGESFLERGYMFHGPFLHPEIINVPLIIHGPGIAARRISGPVGHVDIMPTLLELAGVTSGSKQMGRSLVPLLSGTPDSLDPQPLYSEAWHRRAALGWPHKITMVPQPTFSVRLGQRKLLRAKTKSGHTYECYDLANDPGEHKNILDLRPNACADLKRLISDYSDFAKGFLDSADTAAAGGATHQQIEVDPVVQERLRALGY